MINALVEPTEIEPSTKYKLIIVRIALTAMFTALIAVTTVVLVVDFPAANGYFNMGEASIYTCALLIGSINTTRTRVPVGAIASGFAAGVGAALGDIIVRPQYIIGTCIIKFLEGFIVGFLFKRIKANATEENLRSGRTTMRILQSGYLIGASVIIVGVNADPTDALFWVLIGSLFICTAFVSIILKKVPIYYMIISMIAGGVIMVTGYFLYSTFVLLYPGAYMNLPFDTMQALIGIVIAVPVYQALQKADIVQKI